jgi:hypothetical protein
MGSPPSGVDSAEPFCTSHAVSSTYTPICRNSDSQFANVASPKSARVKYPLKLTVGSP